MDALVRHGVDEGNVEVVWSPGSFEMPVIALAPRWERASTRPSSAWGRSSAAGTDHHQYIAAEAAKGVAQTAMRTGVPCIFGVLTCDTIEQAIERAGAKAGNKGAEAAVAAIEMANLLAQLPGSGKQAK